MKELLSKKNQNMKLENSQLIYIAKNEKARPGKSIKGVAGQLFAIKKSQICITDAVNPVNINAASLD